MKRRQFAIALSALPFAERALAPSAWAQADAWPQRTVRIVCPFTPGGSQDNIARRLAAKLTEYLGQSFVVENRTGAGGSIAADIAAKSPPDGYTMLLGNIGSHALVPHLYARPAYNAFTDLETVVWIGTQPNLLCCRPDYPYDTIPKLIAAAKARPGALDYASSGRGQSHHLMMEYLMKATGTRLNEIPYQGGAPALVGATAGAAAEISTGADGQITLRLADGSEIRLQNNTSVRFTELKRNLILFRNRNAINNPIPVAD